MRIAVEELRCYVDVPIEPRALRDLLDDVGLEVKRSDVHPELGPVLTLELLANRGDHHCYAGLARELSGRLGVPVNLPPITALATGSSPIEVRIASPLCLVYTATLLERTGPEDELDGFELRPLEAAGLHSVSVPVDATNLANLELGQPTHAFDADKIDGPIVVRPSRAGEKAWLLFEPEAREIPEGLLVIADASKILAVAGVIGCEDSKTTETTRRVLLESATFDPVAVRKASRALDVHTDSSARFERGADPIAPLVGAGRVVHLMERHGWQRSGTTGVAGDWRDPNRQLPLEIGPVAAFLEHPLTEEEVRQRLSRYGFVVSPRYPDWVGDEHWQAPPELQERSRERLRNTLLVRVPPHRLWDVEHTADLVEELAKSIGYNVTPQRLPPVDMGALPTAGEVAKAEVDALLVDRGFFEVFTDGFYGRDVREKLGLTEDHPLWAHVETLNSLERGYSLLKNNALAQAVETVATNLRQKTDRIKAFEWTRTFHPDEHADNDVCTERRLLWLVACGPTRPPSWRDDPPDADLYYLKGLLAEIAALLGLELTLGVPERGQPLSGLLHPHRQATIVGRRGAIGILGEVHPRVCGAFGIKRERPVYLELQAASLLAPVVTSPRFVAPPERQPVERDLAFTLPDRVTAGEVADHLQASGPVWLDKVEITDLFEHEQDGRPVRTVTFRATYAPRDRQLTAEEINQASEMLVKAVLARFGERGVKLRG